MSADRLWRIVREAWAKLGRPPPHQVASGRPREAPDASPRDAPEGTKGGFAEEALPWLSAVYRFSLRLTQGDADAADDLAQETFMRAYRSWESFERGTNAKSWLFTICRNTFLKAHERAAASREIPASAVESRAEPVAGAATLEDGGSTPERELFEGMVDEEVVRAIDELPEDFREVLVLSDLGDLRCKESSEVGGVPIGTVRSRLFRARRLLQERLLVFAREAGYVDQAPKSRKEER